MVEKLLRERAETSELASPLFFRLADSADRAALERLLRDDPRIVVHDAFVGQLEELVATRNPSRTLAAAEVADAIGTWLGGRSPETAGVWVYYPWSHRLVHLLDEADFVELRTDRNRYKITRDEQAILSSKRVGVVGLSVGQSVSLTLAMERGFGELRIADFDHLGPSNLNRIRAGVHSLGLRKTVVVAREIAELDPYLRVRCFPDGLTDANMNAFFLDGGKLDLVVDECDDLTMKILLRVRARELGIPVVMDTSDRGLIDVERFDREPDRPLFHGLVGDLDPAQLRGLSTEDKVPYVLRIIGEKTVSARMIASLLEVGTSIKTWPQLASSVVLGGAVTADVLRRIFLGQFQGSGRFFVDLEELVRDGAGDVAPVLEPAAPPADVVEAPRAAVQSEGAERDAIVAIVKGAIAAPSGGNCQPWRFFARGGRLWLTHDRARSHSLLDYDDTAAMLALGAAVENAVLTAHGRGLSVSVTPFPDGSSFERTVAVLDVHSGAAATSEDHRFDALAELVGVRCTNRKLGARRPLETAAARALESAATSVPGVSLHLLQGDRELAEIGRVLGGGDRVRFLNKQLHGEMMSEVRWSRDETMRTRDGIDVDTLELSASDRAGIQLCRSWPAMQLVSRVGGGFALEKSSKKAVDAASAVGLLVAEGASARDFFFGGRALQRVWLTATSLGLAFQPMSSLPYLFARLVRGGGEGLPANQAKELRELRRAYEALFRLAPHNGELLLFRVAYAPPPSAVALRRPVEDVLSFV